MKNWVSRLTDRLVYIVTCQAHPVFNSKIKANQVCDSCFFFNFCLGGYLTGPPVDGPKDPWPHVLSLPGRFIGDPASLACDNILGCLVLHTNLF